MEAQIAEIQSLLMDPNLRNRKNGLEAARDLDTAETKALFFGAKIDGEGRVIIPFCQVGLSHQGSV